MKNLVKAISAIIICLCCLGTQAQTARSDKKATRAAEVKKMINKMNYVFNATYVNPLRGGGKALTSEYDVTVSKDKLVVYLPYFGRAYSAPMDASDGGIKLNTTHFDYKVTENKKGGWDTAIKPKEKGTQGSKDVQQLRLTISADGYGTLQVTGLNRDPISFNGNIEEIKKAK